jgi:hypothetical protein
MLARRSRKLRAMESTPDNNTTNNILVELTTPIEDGSIPLVNFLENTEKFIRDNSNLVTRIYDLERENAKYKQLFRQYETLSEQVDKWGAVVKVLAEGDDRIRIDLPTPLTKGSVSVAKMPISAYFGESTINVKETTAPADDIYASEPPNSVGDIQKPTIAMDIDELLRTNITLMAGHIQKMKRDKVAADASDKNKFRNVERSGAGEGLVGGSRRSVNKSAGLNEVSRVNIMPDNQKRDESRGAQLRKFYEDRVARTSRAEDGVSAEA